MTTDIGVVNINDRANADTNDAQVEAATRDEVNPGEVQQTGQAIPRTNAKARVKQYLQQSQFNIRSKLVSALHYLSLHSVLQKYLNNRN